MEHIECKLCGARDEKFLFEAKDIVYKSSNEKFRIVRCKKCGLVYLNPRPEAQELSKYYPDSYGPYKQRVSSFKYVESKNPIKRILDVGCGACTFLEKLHSKDPRAALYGVDFDERACQVCRAKGFPVAQGTVFEAKYPDDFFDEAYMSHLLEHVSDPLAVLKETHRILKKGGIMEIRLPNFRSLSRMIFGPRWSPLEPPRHFYHFTPQTLSAFLIKAGFAKVNIKISCADSSPEYFFRSLAYMIYGEKNFRPQKLVNIFRYPAWIVRAFNLGGQLKVIAKK